LGQPHNIGDDVEQSDWAALLAAAGIQLAYRHNIPDPSSPALVEGLACQISFSLSIYNNLKNKEKKPRQNEIRNKTQILYRL
jgi:hypothetical protein